MSNPPSVPRARPYTASALPPIADNVRSKPPTFCHTIVPYVASAGGSSGWAAPRPLIGFRLAFLGEYSRIGSQLDGHENLLAGQGTAEITQRIVRLENFSATSMSASDVLS